MIKTVIIISKQYSFTGKPIILYYGLSLGARPPTLESQAPLEVERPQVCEVAQLLQALLVVELQAAPQVEVLQPDQRGHGGQAAVGESHTALQAEALQPGQGLQGSDTWWSW